MEIQFNKDIDLFKGKTTIEIKKKMPLYRKHFKPIFQKWILEVDFDIENISTIKIIHNKKTYGTTIYKNINNKAKFDIELDDKVIVFVSEIQNSTETFKAKAIFQHEIFHCKEIINSKNRIGDINPYNENFSITTTYNFLYDNAVKLWSEFYACYYNFQINLWHEIPYIKNDVIKMDRWINAIKIYSHQSNKSEIQLSKEVLQCLYKFWYHTVSLLAVYIQNNEHLIIKEFEDCFMDYPYLKQYINDIKQYLIFLLNSYPDWVSESIYIVFGKKLMSILTINEIDFSTSDMHDNFFFICK